MSASSHYWVLALYCVAVVALVAAMIGVSYFLGQRHASRATNQPFESGIVPVADARLRLPVQFYLVAMFFVIFDLEAAFIYAWATALHEAGWRGYFTMLVFILALLAALVYLWRVGALDWGPRLRRPRVERPR
ncbi:MAG TPA: NADH-quinone oxidoreductase subunit A [Stellaceae bacterium]|jgi:NADH-quinone oxidoreductase subunit A|nr:NADH-quinone oxidoreductase subunit A [Stellaceae bacterium]